jgi:hypothetical protein
LIYTVSLVDINISDADFDPVPRGFVTTLPSAVEGVNGVSIAAPIVLGHTLLQFGLGLRSPLAFTIYDVETSFEEVNTFTSSLI